jgi:hypothetical protein
MNPNRRALTDHGSRPASTNQPEFTFFDPEMAREHHRLSRALHTKQSWWTQDVTLGPKARPRAHEVVLVLYVAAVLTLCFALPPWIGGNMSRPRALDLGRAPVWSDPNPSVPVKSVNVPQLALELAAITLAGGAAYALTGGRKRSQEERPVHRE